MTEGQRAKMVDLLSPRMRNRLTRREREEVERIAGMEETVVLSVELAAWIERLHGRAKRALSERNGR